RELTLLGVIRQFFGSSVQIIVAVFTLPLVWLFGHGNQQKGFLGTIIVFGIISLFLILNTFVHVRERFSNPHIAHQPVKVVLNMLAHNQPWIIMSIVIFMYWLVTAIKNQTTIYYFKYTLGDEGLVPWANGFTLAALIGVLMIIRLTDHQSKKKTML
ncbi:MFS transporter, partial [Lacticaseibacillus paracasei]